MSLPFDSVTDWWKFEADGTAEIGHNLTVAGAPTNPPGKFGNGMYSADEANYYYSPVNTIPNPTKFSIDFQYAPDFNIVNGIPADVANHAVISDYVSTSNLFFFQPQTPGTFIETIHSGVYRGYGNIPINCTAGVFSHIFILLNRAGIAGTAHTVRLYQNGGLIYSSIVDPGASLTGRILYFGLTKYSSVLGRHMKAIIDNPKLSGDTSAEYIAAVIANKDTEGWPTTGGFRMLGGGLQSPLLKGVMLQ